MQPYTILKFPDIEYLADEYLKSTKWYRVTGDMSLKCKHQILVYKLVFR